MVNQLYSGEEFCKAEPYFEHFVDPIQVEAHMDLLGRFQDDLP